MTKLKVVPKSNVIQFPTPMRREEVELLACEKELTRVNEQVKALAHDLEVASQYLQELVDEHEVLKDAVENGKEILFFEDDWDD
jgi:hypothetical protein|tara:strand:- start:125 stop:376 length:252 start_codon:yes stop_codon:yes gene_type:complete